MLSLREFAIKANLSRMTISRAFSPNGKIAKSTRERIMRLAEQYDFRPCLVRPSARTGKTKSVGVLYPGFNVSYFSDVQNGIQDSLIRESYLPIMLSVTMDNFNLCLNRLIDHRIDGLIIPWIPDKNFESFFPKVSGNEIPLVTLEAPSGFSCDTVRSDNDMGGRMAARHLLDFGHRSIAICISNKGREQRVKSFIDELKSNGIKSGKITILEHDFSEIRIALEKRKFTALFAANDLLALDVMHIAYELGISIPEDLSVIGYADLNFGSRLFPPLTTIRQDGYTEGFEAGRMIVSRLKGDKSPFRKISVPTSLVERSSVAKPKEKI